MTTEKPDSYKVTLKSGEFSVFTNTNRFKDYIEQLMSGMYGIVTRTSSTPVKHDNILSIVQVCSGCYEDIRQEPGVRVCPSCGERTHILVTEYNAS